MASSREYVDFILEQLSSLNEVSCRAMMGEYCVYYREKVIGLICDNRFLLKPVKSAVEMMPGAPMELPYEGGKEMLLVEDIENRELLNQVIRAMYEELPVPKKKKRKSSIS